MTIVSWNAKVNRPETEFTKGLRTLIRDTDPEVICLQEANTYTEAIRTGFGEEWFIYMSTGWTDADENPVLVKRQGHQRMRQKDHGWGTVRNKVQWIGPIHDIPREGRTWTWVRVGDLIVMSLHRVTAGDGQNSEAYREEYRRLVRFFDRHSQTDLIVFGDTNTPRTADWTGSMQQLSEAVRGRLVYDQPAGVDYALVRGVQGASVNRTKRYGSDHLAAVMEGAL